MWNLFFRKPHPATPYVCDFILRHGETWCQPVFESEMDGDVRLNNRFEAFSLPMVMVLHYLKESHSKLAQNVHDEMFALFDASMREQGVGDLSVGRKIKKMAQALRGRLARYVPLMEASDAETLAIAIAQNTLWEESLARHAAQHMVQAWQNLPEDPHRWLIHVETAFGTLDATAA